MSRSSRLALAAVLLVVASPLAFWAAVLAMGETPRGLRVDGEVLAPTDAPEPWLARRAARYLRQEVRVHAEDTDLVLRRSDLGVSIDLAATTRAVRAVGRTGHPFEDLAALIATYSGETDVDWVLRLDGAAVRAQVSALADVVDRPPRPAQLDMRGQLVALSADGVRVDRTGAVRTLAAALRQGRRGVRVPHARISSGVGDAAPPPVRPTLAVVLFGRYRTEYANRGEEQLRAHNVELATRALDGAVIPAGGTLSFNDRVGPRSRDAGYRLAHVILDGEMVDGLGGGVCQVASTLHAAAFLAGLDVVEHTPHSRPSAYVPMGLDATVVWPRVDLVIANPHRVPLAIRAYAREGEMVVELHARGAASAPRVEWHREILATEAWSDRYIEDETVREGRQRVTQRGLRGYTIVRERTIHAAGGVRIESRRIRYPATDRITRVATGALDPLSGEPIAEASGSPPSNPYL